MTDPERPTDPTTTPLDASDPEAPAAADIVANLEAAATPAIGSAVDDVVPAEPAVPAEPVATTSVTPPAAPPPPVAPPVPPVAAPVAAAQPPVVTAKRRRGLAGTLARIFTFLFGILQALLLLRILLLLLNANADNEIVSAILNVTEPFVEPFRGVFQLDEVTGQQGSVLDIAAIVALVAWTLIETLIVSVLRLFDRRSRSR